MPQLVPQVIPDISDTVRTNYVGFASFVVLVWDHIDTFADEVELIWKGKRKGFFVYLFIWNRYFTPLGFIINLYEVTNETLSMPSLLIGGRCARFVRYEGCTVAMAVEVVGLMMLLRIRAIYPHQRWITIGLGALLLFETVINAWLISRGQPVMHNPNSGIHGKQNQFTRSNLGLSRVPACSMIFDPSMSSAASASAWVPLLYDTIIFGLTIYRTLPPILREEASYIIKRLLEDGLLYYSVIFSVTFVLTFMIVAAPPGTKNICAQMEQLITVAMMSRITLNLKRAGEQLNADDLSSPKSLLFDRRRRRSCQFSERHPSFIMTLPLPTFPANIVNPASGGTEIVFARPSPLPTPITPDERTRPISANEGSPENKAPMPMISAPPRVAYIV